MATSFIEGTFTTAPATSESIVLGRNFDLSLSSMSGSTVLLERSFDAGSTFLVVETYTADAEQKGFQPTVEVKVLYRLRFTVDGGSPVYRLGRG